MIKDIAEFREKFWIFDLRASTSEDHIHYLCMTNRKVLEPQFDLCDIAVNPTIDRDFQIHEIMDEIAGTDKLTAREKFKVDQFYPTGEELTAEEAVEKINKLLYDFPAIPLSGLSFKEKRKAIGRLRQHVFAGSPRVKIGEDIFAYAKGPLTPIIVVYNVRTKKYTVDRHPQFNMMGFRIV